MLSRLCCRTAVPLEPTRVVRPDAARGVRAVRTAADGEGLLALDVAHVEPGLAVDWSFPNACGHVLAAAPGGAGAFALAPGRHALAAGGAALAASAADATLQWCGTDAAASRLLHVAYRPRDPASAVRWRASTEPVERRRVAGLELALLFGRLGDGELHGEDADETTVVAVEHPAGYAVALPIPPGGVGLLWVHAGVLRIGPRGAAQWTFVATATG